MSTVDVLIAAASPRTVRFFSSFVVVWVAGAALLHPFQRRIGGNQAKDGGPGGSEKNIVGVTWFLLSLATGIYFAATGGSDAVG